MRLAQLAREFDVPKNNIINFLSSKGITIETHGNTKVDDEHIAIISQHFGKDRKNPLDKEEVATKEKIVETPTEIQEPIEVNTNTANQEKDFEETSQEKPVEVIKPKKIKLQGIKVLGKIDLPEPAKKPQNEESTKEKSNKTKEPVKRKIDRAAKHKNRQPNKRKRALTYEEKQKREERENQRKKRKLEKELKEKKRKHYQEKIKTKKPASVKKKKKNSQIQHQDIKPEKKIVKHKNPIRRFWAWLNGEYDN